MSFNLSNFREKLTRGGARAAHFQVEIPNPLATPTRGNASRANGDDKIRFMVSAAQLPGVTINPIPIAYFGRPVHFAGQKTFAPVSLTVINDEDFAVRDFFEDWSSRINEHSANIRTAGARPGDYMVNMDIKQFGWGGEIIKNVKLIHAFPTEVSPIDVSWESGDQIETFTVTVQYDWWEARTTDGNFTVQDTLV